MKLFTADYLKEKGMEILISCGTPANEAVIVAEDLVEANLMGIDSHGVIRYIWYVDEFIKNRIKPGAPLQIIKETATTAVLDCGLNFGPVGATRMVEIAVNKAAQNNVACVVSQHCHHVSRLGRYVQKIAEHDLIGIATATSPKIGHFVAPWGGREGRLSTNPLAYAFPTSHRPVILDMATSAITEGKIRSLMYEGKLLPEGCVLDAGGNPTTDPKAFYGPPKGTIMPFGSEFGYKGFGLGLLVDILGSVLVGEMITDEYHYMNGVCLIAINPDAFCGLERFKQLMDILCNYMTNTTAAPGFSEIVMPGALEFRNRDRRLIEGIPINDETWLLIVESARRVGVLINH